MEIGGPMTNPTKPYLTSEQVLEAVREKYPDANIRTVVVQQRSRHALRVTKAVDRLDVPREQESVQAC
jgi:hypothetical protein